MFFNGGIYIAGTSVAIASEEVERIDDVEYGDEKEEPSDNGGSESYLLSYSIPTCLFFVRILGFDVLASHNDFNSRSGHGDRRKESWF